MHLETKTQIAKATLSLLVLVAALFLLGGLVLVLCVGLEINPFRETSTAFLGAAFVGLIGVALVLVLVNVATNVSLIADAKIAELKLEPSRGVLRNWVVAFLATAIALVALVFGGTYLSKERYLAVVHGQAEEVLKEKQQPARRGEPVVGLRQVRRLQASQRDPQFSREPAQWPTESDHHLPGDI